jgi:oxygen-independent coproporphyrinogen-3 oxidase
MANLHRMLNLLGPIPPEVDWDAIQAEWAMLQPPYDIDARRLPLPVWARRGLSENGPATWAAVRAELSQTSPQKAFCIYIHIPFCAQKCAFCDCYSFRLGQRQAEHIEKYVAALEREIRLWSQAGTLAQRPVSTVHFGGGTPAFIGETAFQRLVDSVHHNFNTDTRTEWALETTSSELTEGMFDLLASLGFTRLHLGVQSLDDAIRQRLNRREPATTVMGKLSKALSLGWITSVDLIYGLPSQTLASLLDDIHALADLGMDGFSLYELQRSPNNRRFIEQNGLAYRERIIDYLLFQSAAQILAGLGYRKTLFNHFARARDANLYFTFPERGEDCLALGTIADGVFNDYHYRHPVYAAYRQVVTADFPGLQGGIRLSPRESQIAPLETAILSGRLPAGEFAQILGRERAESLLQHWADAGLITLDPQKAGQLRLTSSGSWFAGEMLAELDC